MKIFVRIDVANHGHQRVGIDEVRKRNVVQVQLTGDGNHDAVESLFNQGSKSAHSQLASQHHIEGLGFGAAGLVTQLYAGNLPLSTGAGLVGVRDELGEPLAKIDLRNRNVLV